MPIAHNLMVLKLACNDHNLDLELHGPSDDTDTLQCRYGQGTPESDEKGVVVFVPSMRVAIPAVSSPGGNAPCPGSTCGVSGIEGVSPASTAGVEGATSVGASLGSTTEGNKGL